MCAAAKLPEGRTRLFFFERYGISEFNGMNENFKEAVTRIVAQRA